MSNFEHLTLPMLIAGRLNHDYVSPLTAISNALEIFELDPSQQDAALELIKDSLNSALGELQFNRIAFGSYSDDEFLSINDTRMRIENIFFQEDVTIHFDEVKEPPKKSEAKIWFLGIYCLRSSFIKINKLEIKPHQNGWQIIAEGSGTKTQDGKYRSEDHWLQIGEIGSSSVHFRLLFNHAEEMNYDVILKRFDDSRIILNIWNKN